MNIVIDLGNQLMAEALSQLLERAGYEHVVTIGSSPANGFIPDVLLVDSTTLRHELLARYTEAKVLLLDTGIEPENLSALLLTYRLHGVLSPTTELHLFKKALKVVSEGQIWVDDGSLKALLHGPDSASKTGNNSSPITGREQEIIAATCQGLSNKEIAERFGLSPCTVKAHLYNIYKKLGVTSRSKLLALTLDRPLERSA